MAGILMMRTFSVAAYKLMRRLSAYLSVFSREPTNKSNIQEKAGDPDGPASLFADIRAEWDRAEEVIKLAEQVTADVVIPAIMELRYAGRRLVDALNCDAAGANSDQITALLEDARFSCHRARHDAIDAALSMMAIDTDNLARQMGYDVVHNSYPDFVNFVQRLDEARVSIALSRRNRNDRDKIYTAISSGDFPNLVQDYKALRRSRTTMEIIVGRKRLGVWLGIIAGAILAIPGYWMSWYFWKHPAPIEQPAPPQARSIPTATPTVVNVSNRRAGGIRTGPAANSK